MEKLGTSISLFKQKSSRLLPPINLFHLDQKIQLPRQLQFLNFLLLISLPRPTHPKRIIHATRTFKVYIPEDLMIPYLLSFFKEEKINPGSRLGKSTIRPSQKSSRQRNIKQPIIINKLRELPLLIPSKPERSLGNRKNIEITPIHQGRFHQAKTHASSSHKNLLMLSSLGS